MLLAGLDFLFSKNPFGKTISLYVVLVAFGIPVVTFDVLSVSPNASSSCTKRFLGNAAVFLETS